MKIANLFTGARIGLLIPLFCLLLRGPGWWALAVFLLAGATDIADGWLARKLNQASRFGAFFDLLADRLLTLVVGVGLMLAEPHSLAIVIPCLILIGRNAFVAGLNEVLPDRVNPRMTWLERFKIGFNFLGFAILMTPPVMDGRMPVSWHDWGVIWLGLSAALCVVTLVIYSREASRAFKAI